jgi:hypothetical protein
MAGAASAQPAVLIPSKPIHGTAPSFRAELPSKITQWEEQQVDLQFEEPSTLYDLEVAMLLALEPELQSVAKRQHLSFEEVRVLVLYDVVTGAAK